MRRLAYVESRDGLDTDTYREDYHGGIWQVCDTQIIQTLICHLPLTYPQDAPMPPIIAPNLRAQLLGHIPGKFLWSRELKFVLKSPNYWVVSCNLVKMV